MVLDLLGVLLHFENDLAIELINKMQAAHISILMIKPRKIKIDKNFLEYPTSSGTQKLLHVISWVIFNHLFENRDICL